jgi:hypothetical protein
MQAIARVHTAEVFQTLVLILRGGRPDGARVAAARELLDRAWGHPRQAIEADGGAMVPVSQIEAAAASVLARRGPGGALDGGSPPG